MKEFLNINNLSVSVDEKNIINNLNLKINQGEIHAIMGPNGSGKSTLSNVLAGKDGYSITNGNISFCEENLLEFSPDERANKGIFLAFQYPVEIPGVTNINFIKTYLSKGHLGAKTELFAQCSLWSVQCIDSLASRAQHRQERWMAVLSGIQRKQFHLQALDFVYFLTCLEIHSRQIKVRIIPFYQDNDKILQA